MQVTALKPPDSITTIPTIQGNGSVSPIDGQQVQTYGVVTGVYSYVSPRGSDESGLYLQDPHGDGKDTTSDAVFVRTPDAAKYHVGDALAVAGTVIERFGMTTLDGVELTRTATKAPLPAALPLVLKPDAAASVNLLEKREGMLVTLPNAMAMGPTLDGGGFVATDAAAHGMRKDFGTERRGQRIPVTADLGVRHQVKTGDRISDVTGPLAYMYSEFRVLNTAKGAKIDPGPKPPVQWGDVDGDGVIAPHDVAAIRAGAGSAASSLFDPRDLDGNGTIDAKDAKQAQARMDRRVGGPTFTMGTFNLENLFDTNDDPDIDNEIILTPAEYDQKLGRLAATIRDTLHGPTLLAVQEAENADVLRDLVSRPELKDFSYGFELLPSSDARGIDVGLLYRTDRVQIDRTRQEQGTTKLPDKDGRKGEKPLFAREPLVADLTVTDPETGATRDLTVMVNHFMSKAGYSTKSSSEDWRIAQATFVRDLVAKQRAEHPERAVVVAGDLNDSDGSKPLEVLTGAGSPVRDIGQAFVPAAERYTYNYQGGSEAIDHMLVTPDLAAKVQAAGVRHVHADFPANTVAGDPAVPTDHDLLYAEFGF